MRGQPDAYAAAAGLQIVAVAFSVPEVISDSFCLSVQQAAKAVMALTRPSVIGAVIIPGDVPVSTQLADTHKPCVPAVVCQAMVSRAPPGPHSGLQQLLTCGVVCRKCQRCERS